MRAHTAWSYAPYRPPFAEVGGVYICRLAPSQNAVRMEWLPCEGATVYTVKYRLRDGGEYLIAGQTADCAFDLISLETEREYEFFVEADNGEKSRVRLARTGKSVGTVINYLHPDDEAYAFSGRYLCSPSLLRHPDGYLLASMDVYAGMYPQNLTLIFRSDDGGDTWHYVSELFPCFWGKMFLYDGAVYMTGVSTEYGDLLIGRSDDGGVTFTEPTVLLRGGNGKNGEAGVHKNPQPVMEYDGRLWMTWEWGAWKRGYHAASVASAPLGCDLLDASNWSFADPIKYDPTWPGVPQGESAGNIEGMLVVMDGELHNIMRYSMSKLERKWGLAVDYRVDTKHPEAPLAYVRCIEYPCNNSKFAIVYDEVSGKYISIGSRIYDGEKTGARDLLSVLVSENGRDWRVAWDEIDMRGIDHTLIGFQYVNMEIDGDDLIYQCRTAINGAHSYHDSNYATFHRVRNFREKI